MICDSYCLVSTWSARWAAEVQNRGRGDLAWNGFDHFMPPSCGDLTFFWLSCSAALWHLTFIRTWWVEVLYCKTDESALEYWLVNNYLPASTVYIPCRCRYLVRYDTYYTEECDTTFLVSGSDSSRDLFRVKLMPAFSRCSWNMERHGSLPIRRCWLDGYAHGTLQSTIHRLVVLTSSKAKR